MSEIAIPDGWTAVPPEQVEPLIGNLRDVKGTRSVDASLYMSPDGTTQLTVMHWHTTLTPLDMQSMIELDRGVAKGTAGKTTQHVSDERHFEGHKLVASAVDVNHANRIEQNRIYVADREGVVHMLNVVCAGPADSAPMKTCGDAKAGMDYTVANWVAPKPRAEDDTSYMIGLGVGALVGIVVAAFAVAKARRFFKV